MEYFTLLNLKKEPFSNSPDPELFFQSTQHKSCMQKLELSIRLRRGLSVVIGDIGTGKSTLCRQLVRALHSDDKKIQTRLILDPEFTSPFEFLTTIVKTFGLSAETGEVSEWQLKDAFKKFLFDQAAKNQNLLVLIIDEGQKLPDFCVEILREFLNYETNQQKLLQIAIFAQKEFRTVLKEKANFADRIAASHHLSPLNYVDTRDMIKFRLKKSSKRPDQDFNLFSPTAMMAIYLATNGYPRKIVMLCSKTIIAILVKNKTRANFWDVIKCHQQSKIIEESRKSKILPISAFAGIIIAAVFFFYNPNQLKQLPILKTNKTPSSLATKIEKEDSSPAKTASEEIVNNTAKTILSEKITSEDKISTNHEIWGTIEFDQNSTLSKMISRVYGRFSNARLEKILKANPQIDDPDKIPANTMVIFPKFLEENINLEMNQPVGKVIAVENNLSEAYNIIKKYSQDAIITIQPINSEKGLQFEVYLDDQDVRSRKQNLAEIPEIIGTLEFDPNSTLSKMIARVYGRFKNDRLNKILKANPQIVNPNHILPGTPIKFPRQTKQLFKPGSEDFWISIVEEIALDEAYSLLRFYPDSSTPLRISAYMHPDKGLRFMVVVEEVFKSMDDAKNAITNLEPKFQESAAVKKGSKVI